MAHKLQTDAQRRMMYMRAVAYARGIRDEWRYDYQGDEKRMFERAWQDGYRAALRDGAKRQAGADKIGQLALGLVHMSKSEYEIVEVRRLQEQIKQLEKDRDHWLFTADQNAMLLGQAQVGMELIDVLRRAVGNLPQGK